MATTEGAPVTRGATVQEKRKKEKKEKMFAQEVDRKPLSPAFSLFLFRQKHTHTGASAPSEKGPALFKASPTRPPYFFLPLKKKKKKSRA